MYGKFHTEKAKNKMSKSHKGRIFTEETKKRMSEAQIKIGNKPPSRKESNIRKETKS